MPVIGDRRLPLSLHSEPSGPGAELRGFASIDVLLRRLAALTTGGVDGDVDNDLHQELKR